MKKMLTAIALTIALPAVAGAQAAPAPNADCCKNMKDMKDCMDMAKMDHSMQGMKSGANANAGNDASQPAAKAPQAETHMNHQQ